MKKKGLLISILLLILLIFSVSTASATEKVEDYGVEIIANCWTANTGFGGSTLYVPYVKVNVTNKKTEAVSKITVKVVFYDETEKSIMSDETSYLVSSSDDPLKPEYSKTAFIKASVGYRSKLNESKLPTITAEVYVNDMLYGQVEIAKTYNEKTVSQFLTGEQSANETETPTFETNDPFGVVITASYWGANTGYTGQTLYVPYVKVKVTNQQESPAEKIVVKAVFLNESDQSVLDDESDYLISYSDTPLKTGYNKTSYMRAGVGYKRQIPTENLPTVKAEIYVNDEYYGKVDINNTYQEETLDIVLSKEQGESESDSSVEIDTDNPYSVTVVGNCWTLESGFGSSLYVPYLKLNVLNQSGEPIQKMKLKAVFYDEAEKVVWSDESDYLVSSSDSPIRHGYSKTSFIKASVGYRAKIDESKLPKLTAEIYLDDKLIGEIEIKNTYTESVLSEQLTKKEIVEEETVTSEHEEPFEVIITTNCWAANSGISSTLYAPYLKIKTINQQGKPADKATIKVVFYNVSEKTLWSDETSYLISSSDTPLKNGYGKVAFVRASVGYKSKIPESKMPKITAEIYVNDELYGEVEINNTYDETPISVVLEKTTQASSDSSISQGETDGKDYGIQYLSNCWTSNKGLNGQILYVPYLKINVTNQMNKAADRIVIHVVFTNESDKTVWSDEQDYLVSYGDTALKPGFNKTAFIHSSVGYKFQPSEKNLPSITAEIYINDELYDTVSIEKVLGD